MSNRRLSLVRIAVALSFPFLVNCSGNEEDASQAADGDFKQAPAAVVQAIQKEFPGAVPYRVAIDSLLHIVSRHNIAPDQVLWGQSTCVDDITVTKNKLAYSREKGPFSFGGLGGLPFTGITGLSAFAHHVPEHGAAILFVAPHIGYNESDGWGKIVRHGQHAPSTCCGALVAALNKLKSSEIKVSDPAGDDYQEQVIEQLALQHQGEIIDAPEPLVALTQVVCEEAERKMTGFAHRVPERHFAYAVVVVGVIINTDYQYEDYLWIDHIAIKDIARDEWIKI